MPEPFTRLTAIAAPLLRDNVDTDAIIPSRETQSVSRDGYGEKLFANWRYQPGTREEVPDFVLNRRPFRQARILLSGRNFGCGSSREAAVWSLLQFGIRCVVAGGYGAIFRNNAVRNGLLPVALDETAIAGLAAAGGDGAAPLTVDLEVLRVLAPDGTAFAFELPPRERTMLLEGADEIALTLKRAEAIAAFRARDRALRPWIHAHPLHDREPPR